MTPQHENSNWGLIQTDFTPADADTEPLRKNKKCWAMANYSRFIRPGARVIATDDPQTLAAVRPGGEGLVLVHTNATSEARELTLNLDGFRTAADGAVERWTTDATRNLERTADAAGPSPASPSVWPTPRSAPGPVPDAVRPYGPGAPHGVRGRRLRWCRVAGPARARRGSAADRATSSGPERSR